MGFTYFVAFYNPYFETFGNDVVTVPAKITSLVEVQRLEKELLKKAKKKAGEDFKDHVDEITVISFQLI